MSTLARSLITWAEFLRLAKRPDAPPAMLHDHANDDITLDEVGRIAI